MLRKLRLSEFQKYINHEMDLYKDYELIDIINKGKGKSKFNKHYEFVLSNGIDEHRFTIPYYVEDLETTVEILISHLNFYIHNLIFYNSSNNIILDISLEDFIEGNFDTKFDYIPNNLIQDYFIEEYKENIFTIKIILREGCDGT